MLPATTLVGMSVPLANLTPTTNIPWDKHKNSPRATMAAMANERLGKEEYEAAASAAGHQLS